MVARLATSAGPPLAQADFPRAREAGLTFRAFTGDSITAEDFAFLGRLYASTRMEELAPVPWSSEEKATFLDMQFRAQHAHYMQHYPEADWLILERGQLQNAAGSSGARERIGRLYLERWPREIRIIDIAVLPAGRGCGYGTALLQDIQELAAGEGRSVGIHVEQTNRALSLYRRLGFSLTENKGLYQLLHWHAPGGGMTDRPADGVTDAAAG